MAKPIFVNGKECEWADLSLSISGAATVKFTNVDYGLDTEKTHLFAGGDEAISIQSGNKKPAGEITLLKGAYDAMVKAAQLAGARDITDIEVDIIFHYRAKGSRLPQTDTCVGCQFSKLGKKFGQGDAKMEISLPFLFLKLIEQ